MIAFHIAKVKYLCVYIYRTITTWFMHSPGAEKFGCHASCSTGRISSAKCFAFLPFPTPMKCPWGLGDNEDCGIGNREQQNSCVCTHTKEASVTHTGGGALGKWKILLWMFHPHCNLHASLHSHISPASFSGTCQKVSIIRITATVH